MPTYSLVGSAYNEEGVIKELAARLTDVMDPLDGDAIGELENFPEAPELPPRAIVADRRIRV